MAEPYKLALNEEWEGMKKFYKRNKDAVALPLTVVNDTALHLAVYSGSKYPLKDLHELSPQAYLIQNDKGNTVLHEAAAIGNVKAAKFLLKRCSTEILDVKNALGETPLFRAAAFGRFDVVKFLHSEVRKGHGDMAIHRTRNDKTSILYIAIQAQRFETSWWLLENDRELIELEEQSVTTCLQLLANMPTAFRSGCYMNKWQRLLYFCLPDCEDYDDNYGAQVPLSSSQGNDCEKGFKKDYLRPSRYPNIRTGWFEVDRIWKKKRNHVSAVKLVEQLIRKDTSWQLNRVEPDPGVISLGASGGNPGQSRDKKPPIASSPTRSFDIAVVGEGQAASSNTRSFEIAVEGEGGSMGLTPLLIASSTGVLEIVKRILEVHPQAIEHVSNMGQNILHKAVKHRQKKIFKLVKKKKVALNWLVAKVDNNSWNLLHHAAYSDYVGKCTHPNPALQLQDELRWFESVKTIVPTFYALHRNNEGETAQEVFEKTHLKLLNDAEGWLKQTAKSCSVITVLIATVAYAAAYTVPGGLDQKTGIPVLIHHHFFLLFAIMDIFALVTSLTSAIMFLSILTAPFKYENFQDSLPRKLTLGITFQYLSVALIMLAFAATILLIVQLHGPRAVLVYIVAFLPVTVFAILHFPLYLAGAETVRSFFRFIKNVFPFNFITRSSFGITASSGSKSQ
ncbi:hypothetical protein QUC31_000532 [Theobroma cacao]